MEFSKPLLAICIAAIFAVTGCQNMSKQAAGTGVGAATGGAIGAIFGGKKGAVIGALAGGVLGNLVGKHLDKQEQAIRESMQEEIESGDVLVQRPKTYHENAMVLSMNDSILFDTGSAGLKPGADKQLNKLIQSWQANPQVSVMLTGHTDNVGSLEMNRDLSLSRANAVTDYLITNGVSKENIYLKGAGELSPIADNNSAAGRKKNRRVDLVFFPTGTPAPEVIPLVSHNTEPAGRKVKTASVKKEFTSEEQLPTIPEPPGTVTVSVNGQPPKIPEPSDVYAFDDEHRKVAAKRLETVKVNERVDGVTPPTIPSPSSAKSQTSATSVSDPTFQSCKFHRRSSVKPIFASRNLCILVDRQTSNMKGWIEVYVIGPTTIDERNRWINEAGKWLRTEGFDACEKTSYMTDAKSVKPPLAKQVGGVPGEKAFYMQGGLDKPGFCPQPCKWGSYRPDSRRCSDAI
jgi:outer membrane protein OmpA-like peptidoglycan-associated protein